ncbi:hypothetical protein D3C72_1571530 [compost metagenome]
MALAARADDLDQVGLGQDRRGAQHRVGDILGLVVGEAADQLARGVGRGGEALGQLGADGQLHGVGQVAEDRAVQGGFGLAALRVAEEAVGQLAQQGAAFLAGRLLRQGDQVGQTRRGVDDRGGGGAVAHGWSWTSVSGAAWRRPLELRIRAGWAGGSARSVEDGGVVSSTGRASR